MGSAAFSADDACEASLDREDIKDRVFRVVHDEINGGGDYSGKPMEDGGPLPVLLGSAKLRDSGHKNSWKTTACAGDIDHAARVFGVASKKERLGTILEDAQESPLYADVNTPRMLGDPNSPASPAANSIGSCSPAWGSPRCQVSRWPSIPSIPSAKSGQEQARPWLQIQLPISSYAVSDQPLKQLSRHIACAPSPTHSVHQSEHSVADYCEIYGDHPMTFEFDAAGNKVPRPKRNKKKRKQERGMGVSPKSYIETDHGVQGLGKGHEPMGPAGAIRYN